MRNRRSVGQPGDRIDRDANLSEWDYGDYDGRTTAKIQKMRRGWSLWSDGVPNGETMVQVATRAQNVIDRVLTGSGDALLFAHGHTLGFEHETRVITRWNESFTSENSAERKIDTARSAIPLFQGT